MLVMQKKYFISASLVFGILAFSNFSSAVLAGPNCTCRFAGQNFKTGAVLCIRGKLSRCEFVLNNTSWKTVAETCPQVKGPDEHMKIQSLREPTLMARLKSRFQF